MDLTIKPFKPRRNSSNTLHSRGEEFVYWKALTRTQSTVTAYSDAIRRFENWVTSNSVKEITPAAIYRYFIFRNQPGKGKISASQDRNLLCSFFSWCVRMGYMASNPAQALPTSAFSKSSPRHKTFSPDEYSKLKIAASGTDWYYAVVCGWHTGLRISDVCLMKWECIDWPSCSIRIVPKKTQRTGKMAIVPIAGELEGVLRARELAKIGVEQFVSEELALLYIRDRGVAVSKQFSNILSKAGISGRTFHSLRHSALERWMNHPNADVITVMDMSGHSNPKMLSRYCQPSIDKKKLIMGIDNPVESVRSSELLNE